MAFSNSVILFIFFIYSIECQFTSVINNLNDDDGNLWVVLISGAKGYRNYRHQADVYHAYQVVKKHGVPAERIITMAYDDIAYSRFNAKPGVILNEIGGNNVYKDIKIDYRGNDVSTANFYNVLKGDQKAMRGIGSGKVVKSNENTRIFLFMDDHGGPGLFMMPSWPAIFAVNFTNILKDMHHTRKYEKMVIYVESCQAGSMFYKILPNDINIYVVTASNDIEVSYACCFDQTRFVYLGNMFTAYWIEDTETNDIRNKTIRKQFETVSSKVKKSHISEYGDKGISDDFISKFQGSKYVEKNDDNGEITIDEKTVSNGDLVESRDVPLFTEMKKLEYAKTLQEKEDVYYSMTELLRKRIHMIEIIKKIFKESALASGRSLQWEKNLNIVNHNCYISVTERFHSKCFDLTESDYALAYLHKFVNLCESGVNVDHILSAIETHCSENLLKEIL